MQNFEELRKFAQKAGFLEHFLILRSDKGSLAIIKGIDNWEELEKVFYDFKLKSNESRVFVNTGIHAHANPTRMKSIKKRQKI